MAQVYINWRLSPTKKNSDPAVQEPATRPRCLSPPSRMMDCADIYLCPDTSYVRLPNDDVIPMVALLIYGVTYALTVHISFILLFIADSCHQIMLPTDDLTSVTKERVDQWIESVHSPLMSQCEGSQAQFELLLDIVLVYRTRTLGRYGLGETEFDLFADHLIKTASKLHHGPSFPSCRRQQATVSHDHP